MQDVELLAKWHLLQESRKIPVGVTWVETKCLFDEVIRKM